MFVQETAKKLTKELLVLHRAYQRVSMRCQVFSAAYLRLQVAKNPSCHLSKFVTANVSTPSVRVVSEWFEKKSAPLTANHRNQSVFLDGE